MNTLPTPSSGTTLSSAALASAASDLPRPLRFLINRSFALLWSGQTISVIGDATFSIILVLWVTLLIASGQTWAPLAVSGVLLATIAPEFLVAPLAGVLADRWDRWRLMLAMDAARTLLV